MAATLHQLDPTQVRLDIEVSAQDLEQARERAFRTLSRRLRVPGFRPGHIPRRIVEQHVGAEHIDHEAIETVVPDAYAKALEEHDLDPVDHPKIDLERTEEGKALKITATVAVKPQIKLGAYTGIKLTKRAADVSDADVDESIENLRRRAATLEPVTVRGVVAGDVVTLDYTGEIDGAPFEGGTATNHTTEISPQRFIPGFAEQLYGAQPNERRVVTVTFPETYKPDTLAGKTAKFDVIVHDITAPVLPPLDDSLAKQVSDLETLDALRNEVRRRLERSAQAQAREALENDLVNALVASHDFPLPDILVQRETESLLADVKETVAQSGLDWNAYLRARNQSEEALKAELRSNAERRVKGALLIEEISKAEKIRVSGTDVDREIELLARSSGRTKQATIAALRRTDSGGRLASAIRRHKTLTYLVEKAEVVEAKSGEPSKTEPSKTEPLASVARPA